MNKANTKNATTGERELSPDEMHYLDITSRHIAVPEACKEEFAELRNVLLNQIVPLGGLETITFRELLHAAWNMSRFRQVEAELIPESPDAFATCPHHDALDRIIRYQKDAR